MTDIRRKLIYPALAGSMYATLTMVLAPISYGGVQLRISEVLTLLPFFLPETAIGLFVGCALANTISTAGLLDIVFGSLATLLGAIGTRLLRKNRWLACLPPILSNTIIVPIVLTYAYGIPGGIPWLMLTVGIGEILSCGLLGQLLWKALDKHKDQLFK